MRSVRAVFVLCVALGLSACATTKGTTESEIIIAEPVLIAPPAPPIPAPLPAPTEPPPDAVIELPVIDTPLIYVPIAEMPNTEPFDQSPSTEVPELDPPKAPGAELYKSLSGWADADHGPGLEAFRRSCESMLKANPDEPVNSNLPRYGTFGDWVEPCEAAQEATNARPFFESLFTPIRLSTEESQTGLLTGYYEPEVEVRLVPDDVYSEPILSRPTSKKVQFLPRADLGPASSRVIAYGRPIDVFFLQIQGSGRLHYSDGRVLRAAYDGTNEQPYSSIGKVMLARGDLQPDQAGKRNIEAWMAKAGPEKTRELMNENARYVFFIEQEIAPGEGPRGAMQVPLTSMGSVAVDPRSHPYGTLAWIETKLPEDPTDYIGSDAGLLVVPQDTGGAIKGTLRGDLFFGSGSKAGALAGIMKHPVRWTILVPNALAPTIVPQTDSASNPIS